MKLSYVEPGQRASKSVISWYASQTTYKPQVGLHSILLAISGTKISSHDNEAHHDIIMLCICYTTVISIYVTIVFVVI